MRLTYNFVQRFWADHDGFVISIELVCVATVAIFGMVVGLTSFRDAAIGEMSDVVGAVQDISQSYAFNRIAGHAGRTPGSDFLDSTDFCDEPEDVAGEFQNCIVLTDPTNEKAAARVSVRAEAESGDVETTVGGSTAEGWNIWSNGQISQNVEIPEDGSYRFSARLWGDQGGPDLPNAAFLVDGIPIDNFDIVPTSFATAEVFYIDLVLPPGSYDFAVEFTNDFYVPPIDRNLLVDWLQVEGPN